MLGDHGRQYKSKSRKEIKGMVGQEAGVELLTGPVWSLNNLESFGMKFIQITEDTLT